MRVLVLEEFGRVAVRERADPQPGHGEVLVEVVATGICGSDIHGYTGENGRREPGQVMGHETVGRVRALGAGVDDPPVGAVVAINPVLGCRKCADCDNDRPQRCATKQVLGVTPSLTAAFAEFVVVPAENAVVMKQTGPIEYGALVEPLAVGFHAARQGAVSAHDRVLIIGGGPIGQACLLAARRVGATNIALSEPDDGRRARASALGANVFSPTTDDAAAQVDASLGGRATVVLDAVGSTQSLAAALSWSTPGARVVLVGMAHPSLEVAAYEVSTHERTIIGSFCYSPTEFAETAAWVSAGGDHLDILIDERVGFDGAQDAFSRLAAGNSSACKVMVFPTGFSATA